MIDKALYVMLLLRANPLRGKWEGLGPGNRDFFGPCEMGYRAVRRVPFGAQKSRDFQAQTSPTCPCNDLPTANIMYRAVSIRGS
jgi:hypothetical protein